MPSFASDPFTYLRQRAIRGGGSGGAVVAPVLGPLTLSPNTASLNSPYNGTVTGKSAGSTLSLSGPGAVGLSVVGAAVSGTPTVLGAVNIIETPLVGLPFTTFGALTVAESTSPPLLARNSRIAAVGDSNTEYGTTKGGGLGHTDKSDIPVLSTQNGDYNVDPFVSLWATNPGFQGANYGVAGEAFAGITSRLKDALRYAAQAYYIAGGTNDGIDNGPAGTAAANLYVPEIQAAHDQLPNAWFVLRACPPVSGGQFSTSRHEGRLGFNAVLKAFAEANSTWCRYVDIYTTNIKPTGEAVDGYLDDGLHFSEYGASLNAPIVKAVFDSISLPSSTPNLIQNNSAGNLAPALAGNTGAKTNVTGEVVTGYTASQGGTAVTVASVVDNAETGQKTQVFDITPAAGSGSDTLTFQPTAASAFTVDAWYMCWAEVEVTGPIKPRIQSAGKDLGAFINFFSADGLNLYSRQFLRTTPFIATATSKPSFSIPVVRGLGASQVRIKRVFAVPIANPYTTWNTGSPPVNTVAPTVTIPGARSVGAVATINPGTWTGMLVGTQQQKRYRAALYRDGVFVSNIDFINTGSYTLVAADQGVQLRFDVQAANQAPSYSTPIPIILSGDITAPVLQTAQTFAGQSTVLLDYNEVLDTGSVPAAGAFSLSNSGGADTIASVAVSGRRVTLTKSRVSLATDVITVTYTPGAGPVRDTAGNAAAALSAQAVAIGNPLVRLIQRGANMVETPNGDGYDYASTSAGFGGTGYGISDRKLPSGADGLFGCSVSNGLTFLSFKTTQVVSTSYNGALLGAGCTAPNGAYVSYGANVTTLNATNSASNDNVRLRRAGTEAFFEVSRSATPDTWIQVFKWTSVTTADLWANIFCGNTTARSAGLPYGSPNTV